MSSRPLTVSLLAGLDVDASGSGLTADERANLMAKLRDEAHKITAMKSPSSLGEHLLGFVTKSLRKPVSEVIGEIWKQRKEMREAGARGSDGHDVAADVDLIDHTMRWVLHPSARLKVDGVAMKPALILDVDVALRLAGVKIVIENACVTKVKAGTLTSTVTISCKGVPLSAPYKKPIDLPGSLDLPNGGIDLSGRQHQRIHE